MKTKIQILALIASIALITFFIFNKKTTSLPEIETGKTVEVDSPSLKTETKNITKKSDISKTDISKTDISKTDISKTENKEKEPIKNIKQEEVTVESAFLVDGKGVDLRFAKNIDDNDIFSTAINFLREESVNNTIAQENKEYYERLALNVANEYMTSNESYDFQLNDIQCGEKTCLFSATSNNSDMWDSFVDDLGTPESGVYTLSHHSYTDDYGNIQHNVFISVDESVNSFTSSEPIENITLSDGTIINYEPNPDGGG